MVQRKATPQQAEVQLLKCVVYITQNPVTFAIHQRRELYLLDQQARERKHQAAYKQHVHTPPTHPAITTMTQNATHHRCK